jgi:tetraacyldisaccharide 4'-kinase
VRAPGFWERDGRLPRLLAPVSRISVGLTARRVARPGWRAPVPVICCGNVTVGGAGKTTLALDLVRRLTACGIAVHCLSRGYGGRVGTVLRVEPGLHPASLVGDEPLLLAALAPTWVGRDRAAAARAAVDAGAAVLLMDDGLQNPGLVKDLAFLVVDGGAGFGNGRVLPAGPLREPVAAAAARCRAAVLIGEDRTGALGSLPPGLPMLRASLAAEGVFSGRRVLAFAGIGRPGKLAETLTAAGAEVVALRAFPDHHAYAAAELDTVLADAAGLGAEPVTTPKDAVRLPPGYRERVRVSGVRLVWEDEAALDDLLRLAVP